MKVLIASKAALGKAAASYPVNGVPLGRWSECRPAKGVFHDRVLARQERSVLMGRAHLRSKPFIIAAIGPPSQEKLADPNVAPVAMLQS